MIQIKRRMDMIINALKADSRFEGVRFIREFTAGFTETPVRGFLASVCVTSTELSEGYLGGLALSGARGDMYTADAEIRIYAPAGQNGSGLSEIAGDMLKVIVLLSDLPPSSGDVPRHQRHVYSHRGHLYLSFLTQQRM